MSPRIIFKSPKILALFAKAEDQYTAIVVSSDKKGLRLKTEDGDVVEASFQSDTGLLKAGSTVLFTEDGTVTKSEVVVAKPVRQGERSGCSSEQRQRNAPQGIER